MDLGYILRRAGQISWRQKALWPYGLVVGLITVGPRFISAGIQLLQYADLDLPGPARQILQIPHSALWVGILTSATLIIYIGLQLPTTMGHTALIGQVSDVENHGITTLRYGWQVSKRYMWKAFLVHLTLVLPIAALAFAGSLPSIIGILLAPSASAPAPVSGFFGVAHRAIAQACCASTTCITLLIAIPLNMLQQLAMRSCILEERGVLDAIAHAWWMLKEFTGTWARLWFVLLLVAIGVLLVLGIPMLLAGPLLVIMSLLATAVSSGSWLPVGLSLVAGAWMTAGVILTVIQVYVSAAWTLAYREFRGLGMMGE